MSAELKDIRREVGVEETYKKSLVHKKIFLLCLQVILLLAHFEIFSHFTLILVIVLQFSRDIDYHNHHYSRYVNLYNKQLIFD